MTVEEHNLNLLHLKRSPGIRSWSLLVGKHWHTFWLFYIHTYNVPRWIYSRITVSFLITHNLSHLQVLHLLVWQLHTTAQVHKLIIHQFGALFPNLLSETLFCLLMHRCRQHLVEAFLCDRLSVCGHAEHGAVGGGCV